MPQASTNDIPLLVTHPNSSRHEILLVSPTASLKELSAHIAEMMAASPNCEEFMSKYKKQDDAAKQQTVKEIKVRWAREGRDAKIWPQSTIVTEDNIDAVLAMVAGSGVGRDVMEITMG